VRWILNELAPDLVIRQAGPEDHPACAEVFLAAYRQAFPLHPPEYYVQERYFESITGEEQWVALQAGRIIAVLSIYWPENFIHSLYVDPGLQGGGIGRRLLDAVMAGAKGVCELKCDKDNKRAVAFYKHVGWREVGEGTAETGPWVRLRK
jgi:ribosomal protein S18 acetylase RimI-like enzyme